IQDGRGGRTACEDCEDIPGQPGLRGDCERPVPVCTHTPGPEGPLPARGRQVRGGRGRRSARPRREGVCGLLLEVRGRALPCHVERRGGPRPPGEPLPLDSRPRVARIGRPWGRLCVEALPGRAGGGRTESRTNGSSGAGPEAGQGGPVRSPLPTTPYRLRARSGL